MTAEFDPKLLQELLDDFYAESDELLATLRQHLTALQDADRAGRPGESGLVEGIARAFHTLKGIAAIAGVRAAEQLAHRTEDVLRMLRGKNGGWDPGRLDLLLDAIQGVEQIITAHRLRKPEPDLARLIARLDSSVGASPSAPSPPSHRIQSETAAQDRTANDTSSRTWTFAPSPELDGRGINVTQVRQRLLQLGEIVSATPSLQPGGKMVFTFVVRGNQVPPDLASWSADGIELQPLTEAPRSDSSRTDAPATEAWSLAPSHLMRVDLARLDELMRIAGELVIQRSRLGDRIQRHYEADEGLREIDLGLTRLLRNLRQAIVRVRLVPISELFTRVPFVVRDLAAESDRQVRVVLEGQHTQIDKYVAERLKEPLLHLVRNALIHGVESPGERETRRKTRQATLTLRARSIGEFVEIEVEDDGRGIDAEAILARAKALGMTVSDSSEPAALLRILCSPGFSTREEADRAAGRGIGMAVVATTVQEIGGTLSLRSRPGQGTAFHLRLPLTLSIVDAMIVTLDETFYAVPQSAIEELIQIEADAVQRIKGTEVVPYRDGVLPLIRLATCFGAPVRPMPVLTIMVVTSMEGSMGLLVDRVLSRREVVVRPLNDPLVKVRGVNGATELGDGRPILILDPAALSLGVVRPHAGSRPAQLSLS